MRNFGTIPAGEAWPSAAPGLNWAPPSHTHAQSDVTGLVAALAALQPLDFDLTAIAALTTTAYGRAFLALVDAAAGRAALGLGTLAAQNGTFSGTHSGTSSGTNTGDQSTVSGNAGTATALQTPRAINGVAFDGTAPITVPADGSTLTGSVLAAGLIGNTATKACAGNDARLSDARPPTTLLSASPSAGVGYAAGAGGTVTQLTSKATGVTLSKVCGQITLNAAALAANTAVVFTLTNTAIAAGDRLILSHDGAGTFGAYVLSARCAAGSATIAVRNVTAGSLAEAIVLGFSVVKSATA